MIPESLQKTFRKQYNPDGSKLREMQLGMLEMLKFIDRICEENNIKYWLSSGTCLGAVRHGGFIPWDDDIDIEMLEKDYSKLVKILSDKTTTGNYKLQNNSNDPYFIYDFSKLRNVVIDINEDLSLASKYKYKGLFIDIFRLEASNSKIIHYFAGRLRVIEFYFAKWAMDKPSIFASSVFCLHKVINVFFSLLRPLDQISSKGKLRHTLGVTFIKPRFQEDIFPIKKIKFEDTYLPVPNDHDRYLKRLYGDYNKIVIGSSHFLT